MRTKREVRAGMLRHLTVVVLAVTCFQVEAGEAADSISPFGLRMGMKLQELQRLSRLEPTAGRPGQFEIGQPPNPHPAFSSYRLVVGQKTGLCQVAGMTESLSRDAAEGVFRRVLNTLEAKYGKHPAVRSERLVAAWQSWAEPKTPRGIRTIVLVVSSPEGDKAGVTAAADHLVMLFYSFDNHEACIGELANAERDAL